MLKVIYCLNALVAVGGFQGARILTEGDHKEVVAVQIDRVPKCLGAFVISEVKPGTQRTQIKDGNEVVTSFPDTAPVPEFIATAAHCVYGVQTSRLSVKSWGNKAEKVGTVGRVISVKVHPYYKPPSPDYDIALLKIDKTIFKGQPGWSLRKNVPSPGSRLNAFIWEENKPRNTTAKLEDRKSCRAKLANHTVVSTRMLCAMTCSEMDGSPLIVIPPTQNANGLNRIVGIGSYCRRGASESTPSIFTNMANSEIYSFVKKYIG